jgi:hypothetical protein
VLLTNEWRLAATTIVRVYRYRWQIEQFFNRTSRIREGIQLFSGAGCRIS